ncbi:protein GVQW3-like [Tachypleus tridentatus]|uniref:protein GVQW3-like n=1 Tax=Tachypleus tridentatus TaxID=6853 RepID=UPI003FD19981
MPFPNCRYLRLCISYVVLSEVQFFRLADFRLNDLKEQRLAVKFCVKLGKSATETFAMLNMAYGDVAMKRTACFKWHERFKDGRQSIEDDECHGRPSTSTDDPHVDKINTLVRANRRLTVRELAEECGILVGSCYELLTEKLKMHRIAANFVPRLMTDKQKSPSRPGLSGTV